MLEKLLVTEDLVEFQALSMQLRSMLHERVENLRNDAKTLKSTAKPAERRKRPRDGPKKP